MTKKRILNKIFFPPSGMTYLMKNKYSERDNQQIVIHGDIL